MPEFDGPGFKINLPNGYVDLSTYAFAIPSSAEFKPSIVIKFEKRAGTPHLKRYVTEQLAALQSGIQNFELISESVGRHGEFESITTIFEWGPRSESRIRQKQCFVLVPEQSTIYTLTATNLAADFDQTESLFNAIIGSFVPK